MTSDKFRGITGGPVLKLEQAIERNGGNMQDVDWLCTRGHFLHIIRLRQGLATISLKEDRLSDEEKKSLIVRVGGGQSLNEKGLSEQPSGINIDVDYDKPQSLLIEEAGCNIDAEDFENVGLDSFHKKNDRGVRRRWFEVVDFSNWHITPEDACEEFKAAKLRPATFVEGLSFIREVGMFGGSCTSIHLLGSEASPVVPLKKGFGKWFRNKIAVPTYHTRICKRNRGDSRNILRLASQCRSGTEWDDFCLAVHI